MNLRELQVWVEGFSNGIAPGRPPTAEQFQKMLQVIAAAKTEGTDVKERDRTGLAFQSDKVTTSDTLTDASVLLNEKNNSQPSMSDEWPAKPKLSEGRLGSSGSGSTPRRCK